jgi:hypothetical protein
VEVITLAIITENGLAEGEQVISLVVLGHTRKEPFETGMGETGDTGILCRQIIRLF